MGIIGAILGDIIGSRFEFRHPNNIDYYHCELFTDDCKYTDDTVLSIATGMAIIKGISFEEEYRRYGRKYNTSYGDMFESWLWSDDPKPYGSCGNGSAMRVSPILDLFSTQKDLKAFTKRSALVTHNNPECIKGATATNLCAYLAKVGDTKNTIYSMMKEFYPKEFYRFGVDRPLNEYEDKYIWSDTCQNSVPVAIRCFLESDSFEDCLRKVIYMRCDTDTICAIAGHIEQEFYKTTGFKNHEILKRYLDPGLYNDLLRILKNKVW